MIRRLFQPGRCIGIRPQIPHTPGSGLAVARRGADSERGAFEASGSKTLDFDASVAGSHRHDTVRRSAGPPIFGAPLTGAQARGRRLESSTRLSALGGQSLKPVRRTRGPDSGRKTCTSGCAGRHSARLSGRRWIRARCAVHGRLGPTRPRTADYL